MDQRLVLQKGTLTKGAAPDLLSRNGASVPAFSCFSSLCKIDHLRALPFGGAGGTGAFPPENGAKLHETLFKGPVPLT